jgi:HEAT repeat protein
MDRFAKAIGALAVLVLIKPWGFGLTWQQLSYASLTLMAVWIVMAARARREYLASFRRSLARHELEATEIRAPHADLQTIEVLIEELAHPDDARVLHAIDLLESLEKRHLITPLLLHHDSPAVRARTLRAFEALRPEVARRWLPAVERLLADEDAAVRSAALHAMAAIRGADAPALLRQYLADPDPRTAITAAAVLARGGRAADVAAAEAVLERLAADRRDAAPRPRPDARWRWRSAP